MASSSKPAPVIVRGKLNLKGSSSKKKSVAATAAVAGKKRSSSETEKVEAEDDNDEVNTTERKEENKKVVSKEDSGLTEAQRRYRRQRLERELKLAKQSVNSSYRERVENFNFKLSKMTEHNDIPRVSAAGNG